MKRPYIVHFIAILADDRISVKASITKEKSEGPGGPKTAIQSLYLFSTRIYRIKIQAFDKNNNHLSSKEYESDSFGNFSLKFPSRINGAEISSLKVYELRASEAIEFMLGVFSVYKVNEPKKILISDFDKTIVDTKYSNLRELYFSLSKPVDYYPRIDKTYRKLLDYRDQGFQTFILSASPHFYENAFRAWLDKNEIKDVPIFLKDYRNFLSFSAGLFSKKDLKEQGFYKLDQLINILLMSGIPNELILFGDCFESDELIYLTLSSILLGKTDAWSIWDKLKKDKNFCLTSKQDSLFLSKLYKINEKLKGIKPDIKIFIRYRDEDPQTLRARQMPLKVLNDLKSLITYY